MKVVGVMTRKMVKVSIFISTQVKNMKVSGLMVKSKATVFIITLMVINILGNGNLVKEMVKEF